MVELSNNEIVCMVHTDMYIPPKFDQILLKYMQEYGFIYRGIGRGYDAGDETEK